MGVQIDLVIFLFSTEKAPLKPNIELVPTWSIGCNRHAIHAPVGGIESSKCDASCGSKSYGYYSIWMDDMDSRKKIKSNREVCCKRDFFYSKFRLGAPCGWHVVVTY